MIIDSPSKEQIPMLWALWKEAFGDTDEFIKAFEKTAFSADRCRCIVSDGEVAAALYWFECEYKEQRLAYIYAVATKISHRGQGLCNKLMKDTHKHLQSLGYAATVLVPGEKDLFDFYYKMGYRVCSYVNELFCDASDKKVEIYEIEKEEYAKLRRKMIDEGGVVQEGENLEFLSAQAKFYRAESFLLAARGEKETLYGIELLGDETKAGEVLNALGYKKGKFRMPGDARPFSMYLSLKDDAIVPSYFGFAFD